MKITPFISYLIGVSCSIRLAKLNGPAVEKLRYAGYVRPWEPCAITTPAPPMPAPPPPMIWPGCWPLCWPIAPSPGPGRAPGPPTCLTPAAGCPGFGGVFFLEDAAGKIRRDT